MPDFRRWEWNADGKETPLPPGELVWSAAKHTLFRRCERAWYFRHYLAQGGWDAFAADPSMRAYLEKYLTTLDSWLGTVTEETLAEALDENRRNYTTARMETLLETWQIGVSTRLLRAREELLREEYLTDPKKLSFVELHYPGGEFSAPMDLWREAKKRFTAFFAALDDSELPDELASVEPPAWRLPPEHRVFPLGGQPVALRPYLYAVRHRMVTGWTFHFRPAAPDWSVDPEDEENGLPERVFAAWCQGKYPGFAVKVRKIFFTDAGLIRRLVSPVPTSPEWVRESARAMLDRISRPGGVKRTDFSCAGPEICAHCNFRGLCAEYPLPERTEKDGPV